jgi:hypothetical protein
MHKCAIPLFKSNIVAFIENFVGTYLVAIDTNSGSLIYPSVSVIQDFIKNTQMNTVFIKEYRLYCTCYTNLIVALDAD